MKTYLHLCANEPSHTYPAPARSVGIPAEEVRVTLWAHRKLAKYKLAPFQFRMAEMEVPY